MFVVITKSKSIYYLEKVDHGDYEEQKRQTKKTGRVQSWVTYEEMRFSLPGRVLWVSIDKNDDSV